MSRAHALVFLLAAPACFEVPSRPLTPNNSVSIDTADTADTPDTAGSVDADLSDIITPVAPCFLPQSTGCTPIAELAAGADHTCARTEDGRVFCWGDRRYGQVGDRIIASTPATPTRVDLPARVRDIASGLHHTCALTVSGAVLCWGRNMGVPASATGTPGPEPTPIPLPAAAASVHGAAWTSCALLIDGRVTCWGTALDGRAYDPSGTGGTFLATPALVPSLPGALGVSTLRLGADFACAWSNGQSPRLGATLDGPDAVRCWGDASHGQLGLGSRTDQLSPARLSTTSLAALALGTAHACLIQPDGLYCWGDNAEGQLGQPVAVVDTGTPLRTLSSDTLAALGTSPHLALGDRTTCLATTLGVHCWGRGQEGLLGISAGSSIRPTLVVGTDPARHVALGLRHACAITTTHAVQCWGDGQRGALDGTDRPITRSPITLEVPAVDLLCAYDGSEVLPGTPHPETPCTVCARDQANTPATFVPCSLGCLSDRCRAAAHQPRQLGTTALTFAAVGRRVCAILDDASVMCADVASDLTLTATAPPLALPPASGLALASAFNCLHDSTGQAMCWDSTNTLELGPVTAIAAGGPNVCRLDAAAVSCATLRANAAPATFEDLTRSDFTPHDLGPTPTSLVVSHDHVCALGIDPATIHCSHLETGAPLALTRVGGPIDALTAGTHHFNFITSLGVGGFGSNTFGQVTTTPTTSLPDPIVSIFEPLSLRGLVPAPIRVLAAGPRHACALSLSGLVYCWGNGRPPELQPLAGVTHLAAGDDLTCAIVDGHHLRCWDHLPVDSPPAAGAPP